MKRCKDKLGSRRGETLAEVLAALLVMGLSVMMMVGMVTAAVKINQDTRKMDRKFFEAVTGAETIRKTSPDGKINIQENIQEDAKSVDLEITYYGQEGHKLISYRRKTS